MRTGKVKTKVLRPTRGPSRPGSRTGAARTRPVPFGLTGRAKYYRWPEIGRTVQVFLSGETTPLPARILEHDTSGDCIVVSAPGGRGEGAVIAEPGDKVALTWVLPEGVAKLETAFLSWTVDTTSKPSAWRLEPASDVQIIERRRHRRLRARQNVALRSRDVAIPGVMVDISEGGMRCLVDTITPSKLTRDRVQSTVTVRGRRMGVQGLVTWSKHHGGHVEVGIAFDRLRKQDVEALRAHVRTSMSVPA